MSPEKLNYYKGDAPTAIGHIIYKHSKRFMKSMALETGISDHHQMIMITFCSAFVKGKPKTFYCRYYKMINLEQFHTELTGALDEISKNSTDIFLEEICLDKD